MFGQPVVVGVDASSEAALAVSLGSAVADAAAVECHLVHVLGKPAQQALERRAADEQDRIMQQLVQTARHSVRAALPGVVKAGMAERLEVRVGNPAWELRRTVAECGAGLLVLGGKHHPAPVRWFGGSTVHHAVRTVDVPLLVTAPCRATFSKVLVAIDLSDAAQPTLQAALEFSALFDAAVRVLHVVEPLPSIPDVGIQLDEGEHLRLAEVGTSELVASVSDSNTVDQVVRCGASARAIADEAGQWEADLVIVGSHGKGWVDRVLLGSTTERLLNKLPCPVLVIPVRAPGALSP